MSINLANRNDLARVALLASDAAYAGTSRPIGTPLAPALLEDPPRNSPEGSQDFGFRLDGAIEDESSGFKAQLYKSESTNDLIVAFAGTDGLNPVDWWSNTAHLGLINGLRTPSTFAGLFANSLTRKHKYTLPVKAWAAR